MLLTAGAYVGDGMLPPVPAKLSSQRGGGSVLVPEEEDEDHYARLGRIVADTCTWSGVM